MALWYFKQCMLPLRNCLHRVGRVSCVASHWCDLSGFPVLFWACSFVSSMLKCAEWCWWMSGLLSSSNELSSLKAPTNHVPQTHSSLRKYLLSLNGVPVLRTQEGWTCLADVRVLQHAILTRKSIVSLSFFLSFLYLEISAISVFTASSVKGWKKNDIIRGDYVNIQWASENN